MVGHSKPAQTPKKKKIKRFACNPRTPTLSDEEDSQSNTISDICTHEQVQHEIIATTETLHPMVSQLTPTQTNHEVSFSLTTSVPLTYDFFPGFCSKFSSSFYYNSYNNRSVSTCTFWSLAITYFHYSHFSILHGLNCNNNNDHEYTHVIINVPDTGARTYGFLFWC